MPTKRDAEVEEALKTIQGVMDKAQQTQRLNPEEVDVAEIDKQEANLKILQSMVNDPESYSFLSMTHDHLYKMNISCSGKLTLKMPDALSRATETDSIGVNGLWSADALYRHLCLLEDLVPRKNEAAARMWTNAFFYRVTAMTPSMVLSVEQIVPSVTLTDWSHDTLSGYVNWMAMAMTRKGVRQFMRDPRLCGLKEEESVLFILEAKGPNQVLNDRVAQAIGGMYACARTVGKGSIRGVLTNGHSWIFLILTLNKDGGGSYLMSSKISILDSLEPVIAKEFVSLISAIIAHWMVHSHDGLDINDDYFTHSNV